MHELTADDVAELLEETDELPRQHIATLVQRLGPIATAAVLDAVVNIQAQGGLPLADGSRQRTLGGVFFHITGVGATRTFQKPQQTIPVVPLATALAAIPVDLKHGVCAMKLTLVGRPKETVEHDGYVALKMRGEAPRDLPKGLPIPPQQTEIVWTVLVAQKQWQKVASALRADPDDKLIIEGTPCQQGTTLVLYAKSITTVGLQRQAKEVQRAKVS